SPVFSGTPFSATLTENDPIGTTVLKVIAIDEDSADTLSYSLSGSNSAHFAIGSSTGVITTAQLLDRETVNSYSLTVSVSDGTATVNQALSVTINDANDAPLFTNAPYNATVNENAGSGSVYTVSATDADSDVIAYSIYGHGSDKFSIHSSSGLVTLASAVDFETKSSFVLTVQAADTNGAIATTSLYVDVVNQNDSPAFMGTPYSTSIIESVSFGTTVFRAQAVDEDTADTLSYSLSGTNNAHFAIGELFSIHPTSGVVSVTSALDAEVTSLYVLTVRVSDGKGGVNTSSLSVTVIDVNDRPAFVGAPYAASVSERLPSGTGVVTLIATDQDGDSLTYSISGTNHGHFSISPSTGLIQTAQILDYESVNSYTLTASVTDGSVTVTTSVTISVTNTNDPPTLSSSYYNVSINENDAALSVIDITGSDSDGDTLTYSLTGTGSGDFSMNSATGLITLATAL
ncbi:predicted protein, partial [Nematostella vectensis]